MADDDKESKLSDHSREKKKLLPPFSKIKFTPSSWVNDRMPDMLWAVLLHRNLGRDKALEAFREVAHFVEDHQELYDITHRGIAKVSTELRQQLIQKILEVSPDAQKALRPLLLFPKLPNRSDWANALGDAVPSEDWRWLVDSVSVVLWHQSEQATDCRWVKLLCTIVGGKMKFFKPLEDTLQGILEYPNYGDLSSVRPSIRAAEIGDAMNADPNWAWPKEFWDHCYASTDCFPEHEEPAKPFGSTEQQLVREHYFEESTRIWKATVDHFFESSETTTIDARHEGAFAIALFAQSLFTELILGRIDFAANARLALRSLAECAITISYLVKEDDPQLWAAYRSYGIGQAKLVYLKWKEAGQQPDAAEIEMLRMIANEDAWQEFVEINLGHWDGSDLRNMSEKAGVKEIYDQYYAWTSGYTHGSWAAARESVMQRCANPLHRMHRIPLFFFTRMKSVPGDAANLLNIVLENLGKAYPGFVGKINPPPIALEKTSNQPSKEDENLAEHPDYASPEVPEESEIIKTAVEGFFLCLKNAEDFLVAAQTLFASKQWRESYLMSMYAGEEMGKAVLVFNYPLYALSLQSSAKWRKRFNDHEDKLRFLFTLKDFDNKVLPGDHEEEVEKLAQRKTGVAYVSMSDKSFNAPDVVSESEAQDLHQSVKHRVGTMREQYPSEEDLKGVLVGMIRNPPDMKKVIAEMQARDFT